MLRQIPIALAQVQARNDSQKRKNVIRQLLYTLKRSKKITKKSI